MKLHPQYLLDEEGRPKSVLLPADEYARLLEAVEDQLDASDLDQAAGEETEIIPYEQARADLRAKGKL